MALPIWVHNLIVYSLQIAILASAGTLLAFLFRLRVPRVSLVYWQVLLLVCLLVPALQNWKHPVYSVRLAPGPVVYTVPGEAVAVRPKPAISVKPEAIALALGAGACLRLIWLAMGLFRLRLFLRKSQPLAGNSQIAESLSSRIGVQARFFLSNEVDSPATFGVLSPTVILPQSFSGMSEACREALVCHELLHVRRRDWALILIEEVILSIYWFHPAVWWLLARIHLAREQSVDREVVRLTGSRQPYLDSLLEIARARGRPRAVPAPLFLGERHLVQRVALLLKEASMNRLQLVVSLAGVALLLAGTVRLASGWFPLTGAPVFIQAQSPEAQVARPQREPLKVGGNVQMSKLIFRAEPVYPERAKAAHIAGQVILEVTVNEKGQVWDVQVSSGDPVLAEAAVSAVKQWLYSSTLLNGEPVPVMATVTVEFSLGDQAKVTTGGASFTAAASGNGMLAFNANASVSVLLSDGLGGYIIFRAIPIDEKGFPSSNSAEYFHSPELAFDKERLHMLAEAQWPADVAKATPVTLLFRINEAGEIQNLMRVRGPDIPEVERELEKTRVTSPGLRGSTPVSSLCVVEIWLQRAGGISGGIPGGVHGGVSGGVNGKR